MDGKEVYDHELVLKAIKHITRWCHKKQMNLLEVKKACEAISISCDQMIQSGMENLAKEEAPNE